MDIKSIVEKFEQFQNDMKNISIIILLFLPFCCCSQDKITSFDFSIKQSREKADSVLGSFESFRGLKMLYSVRDSEYYIILKKDATYEEHFVSAKDVQTLKITRFDDESPNLRIFKRIFKLKQYHTGLTAKMPDAKFIQGDLSYFVIKDELGNRYGEFSLPFLTVPSPIDKKVYAYLTTKIAELSFKLK